MTEFRLKRELFWTGLLTLVCFLAIGGGSVVAAVLNIDGSFRRPILAAVVLDVFWSGWVMLSLLLLAAYYRSRWWVADEGLAVRGVFRSRAIALDELEGAWWRRWPAGGSLVLRDGRQRVVLDFGNLSREDREAVVRHLHEQVPLEKQHGWDRFDECRDARCCGAVSGPVCFASPRGPPRAESRSEGLLPLASYLCTPRKRKTVAGVIRDGLFFLVGDA
jgi:hypothetical protein